MLPRDYPDQFCSLARSLEIVGERWTLLVLRDVTLGLSRFDDLAKSLGIARNVLASRLDRLCEEGLLERRLYQERPARHEYVLTRKGRDLTPAMFHLMKWGDEHYPRPGGPPRLSVHRECGGQVDADRICDRCGERAAWREIAYPPGPALEARAGDRPIAPGV